jgi:hypothetical protein
MLGSNQRPLRCERSALPLSQSPRCRRRPAIKQRPQSSASRTVRVPRGAPPAHPEQGSHPASPTASPFAQNTAGAFGQDTAWPLPRAARIPRPPCALLSAGPASQSWHWFPRPLTGHRASFLFNQIVGIPIHFSPKYSRVISRYTFDRPLLCILRHRLT